MGRVHWPSSRAGPSAAPLPLQTFWVVIRGRNPGVYEGRLVTIPFIFLPANFVHHREAARQGLGNALGGILEQVESLSEGHRVFTENYMTGNIYTLPPPRTS
jgi:hypothetical protein